MSGSVAVILFVISAFLLYHKIPRRRAQDGTPNVVNQLTPLGAGLYTDFLSNRTANSVRILLTPLDGASVLWKWAPPWHPIGCLFAHTHVIVTTADRDYFRTYEYHPVAPPLLMYLYGTGEVRRTTSTTWLPIHRHDRLVRWLEFPLRNDSLTFGDIEQFNQGWCCPYDMMVHTCQHYSIALVEFISGMQLDQCFLYDRVSLAVLVPIFLFINLILMSVMATELLAFFLHNVVKVSMYGPRYKEVLRYEMRACAVALLFAAAFVLLCEVEFRRQQAVCRSTPDALYCRINDSL